MRKRVLVPALAMLPLAGFALAGCNKDSKDSSPGDSTANPPKSVTDSEQSKSVGAGYTGSGGTGNAGTSIGSGATNTAVGSETRNAVGGPGNTPTGQGATTQPSTQP